ncbi:protein-L-isoaspartate O-methyltransferase family protein [Parasphingorhabdus sp.]|uniref:protein-L-isoaspartate O-methyltransferase family protein n=1 Tax=Parasphingorhabdus sp. TaxID=2709688 RepID=UPI003A946B56
MDDRLYHCEDRRLGQENFRQMRKAMVVSQLRTTEVSDPRVIAVMSHIAREDFVPAAQRSFAYADRGVPIGEGRALNPPLTTGRLLNVARITKADKVLLIGAATGYTAALLAELAGSVTAVEQNATFAETAAKNLATFDNVEIETGNHADGWPTAAPYSVIVIDGLVEQIPQTLIDQLAPEGRIVASMMHDGVARLALGRTAGGHVGYQYFADGGGCPLPGFEMAKSFKF